MEREKHAQPEVDKTRRALIKGLGASIIFPHLLLDGLADCPDGPDHCLPPTFKDKLHSFFSRIFLAAPPPTEAPTPLPTETAQPTATTQPRFEPSSRSAPRPTPTEISPDQSSLEKYLNSIEPLKTQLQPAIENNDLFQDPLFKKSFTILTKPEERVADFEMYFPMYMAGEEAYQVPWSVLWLIHIQETTVSRSPQPEHGGLRGGMQIHTSNDRNLVGAAKGWEFLDTLPQRYSWRNGSATNDWEEILRASLYIRRLANLLRANDDEAAVLNVMENSYSAKMYGQQRVAAYQLLRPYLSL